MSFPFNAIVYGPFGAQYHRDLVDNAFHRALCGFLAKNLLPQVDHDFTLASGSLTACFDEDCYCGPRSLVRNYFRLEFAFRGSTGHSRLKTELAYDTPGRQFRARRGHSLYLWTPARQRRRVWEQEEIRKTANAILDRVHASCPICSADLSVVYAPNLFDLVCPNRCFEYSFHKDEAGRRLHGHFFLAEPASS